MEACAGPPRESASQKLRGRECVRGWGWCSSLELSLNQGAQRLVQFIARQTVQDFLEESEREELVGGFLPDAARLKIELLLGIDSAARGAVGATDIVGLNL